MKVQKQIDLKLYKPTEGFIFYYQKLVKNTVIPYQLKVLNDEAKGASKSHVVANFINAGKVLAGQMADEDFYGMVFQDSDAAKWLEAVAYSLIVLPDAELEKTADELIDILKNAQDTDGYLNTRFTIKDKEKRWTNLLEGHELYCAGHMMEAACAYLEATGKDTLFKVMMKNVKHIYDVFITNNHPGYPGHPEVELALMRMYRLSKDKTCLDLAKHFIDVRGVDPLYFNKERKSRDWVVWGGDGMDFEYQQSAVPLREWKDVRGHAVRAVYLLTGMADLATETEDKELYDACERLWESIADRQMYITGGIGSTVQGEAFSADYDLPNDTAYAETCASIGLMFFASKMLEKDVDSKYSDVMERAFYNTVLGGIQLDGQKYFYVNPLEVIPGISGVIKTHKHTLPQRPGWYDCACCPPNAARLISSLGKYAYGENESTAYCHMYAAGDICFENGLKISCETNYPYELCVKYKIREGKGRLAVRIPKWSQETFDVSMPYIMDKGYAYIDVEANDEVIIKFNKEPYMVYASNSVAKLSGYCAVCRGPLVYCFEGVDNGDVLSLVMGDNIGEYSVGKVTDLGDALTLKFMAKKRIAEDTLYSTKKPEYKEKEVVAVPYYCWGNRGENQMRVWLPMA